MCERSTDHRLTLALGQPNDTRADDGVDPGVLGYIFDDHSPVRGDRVTVPSSQGPDTLPSIPRFDATTPPPPLGVVRSQMIAGPDMSSRAAKSLLLGLRRQLVVQAAVFGGFGVLLVVFGAFMAADDSSSSVLIYGCALLVLTPALPFFAYRRIIAVWARFAPAGTPMSSEFSLDRLTLTAGPTTNSVHASAITGVAHLGTMFVVRTRQFATPAMVFPEELVPPAVGADLLARYAM